MYMHLWYAIWIITVFSHHCILQVGPSSTFAVKPNDYRSIMVRNIIKNGGGCVTDEWDSVSNKNIIFELIWKPECLQVTILFDRYNTFSQRGKQVLEELLVTYIISVEEARLRMSIALERLPHLFQGKFKLRMRFGHNKVAQLNLPNLICEGQQTSKHLLALHMCNVLYDLECLL